MGSKPAPTGRGRRSAPSPSHSPAAAPHPSAAARRAIFLLAALLLLGGAWLLRQSLTANQADFDRYLQGVRLARQGRYPEAVQTWERLRRDAPAFPDPALQLARHYTQTGRIPQAVGVLKDLLRANPSAPGAYTALAEAYAKAIDWPEALTAARKAVRQEPNSAAAHAALAVAWGQNFSLEKARAEIAQAQRLAPADAAYYLRGALIERDADQYPQSEAQARLCLAHDPQNAEALNALGWAIRHQPVTPARTAEALKAFLRAGQLDATLTPAFVESGAIFTEQGQFAQARPALQRARVLAAIPDVSGRFTQKHLQTRIRIDSLLLRAAPAGESPAESAALRREIQSFDARIRALPPALRAKD